MKKTVIIICFASVKLFAQIPSDVEVLQKIKDRYSGGKTPTIKLGGSSNTKEFEGAKWHYYYWRHYTIRAKAKDSQTALEQSGSVVYEKVGNQYIFDNYATGETNLSGMKVPDKGVVEKYLNTHLKEFFISNYGSILAEKPKISVVAGTTYKWKATEGCVSFITKVIYKKKVSYTEIETAEHYFETSLFREPLIDESAAWNRVLADEIESKKKVISKKKYPASEIDAMKSLQEIEEESSAAAVISSLPYVEDAPVFESDKQLFYYIHDRLMASAPQKAKAHLYKVLASSNFQSGSILKQYVQEWADKLIGNLKSYQYTFCQYPKVKDEQNGMIYFYNKDKSRFVRMTAEEENNTWKIKVIEYFPATQTEINRLWKLKGNCAEKPDLTVKIVKEYKIGDIVDVTFSNGTFPAEVKKRDTSFDNRYFVSLLEGGRGYWVTEDTMSLSSEKKEVSKNENAVTKQVTEVITDFKVGDHVGIKTRSGVMNGTITKATGSNYLIKLDESGYQDMWVKKEHLVKL
jgi:ribosomal protein L21E